MIATKLKTEYLHSPLGIDIVHPRLHWNCEGGITQTAYQVLCRDENGKILWDSGKNHESTMRVQYSGEKLKSRSVCVWQVRLWDENGQPVFNEVNTLPGVTASSMYPMLWEKQGISKKERIARLIDNALKREAH